MRFRLGSLKNISGRGFHLANELERAQPVRFELPHSPRVLSVLRSRLERGCSSSDGAEINCIVGGGPPLMARLLRRGISRG